MPVFFSFAGLHADLSVLGNPQLLLLGLGLIAIASIGKFAGAFLGGALGRLSVPESVALACGMNARGSTEVIVASIGLSIGVISQDLFTMIVTMAIVTTLAMPPTLRWALARLPLHEEEKARLAREAFEAKGFVSNLERLLVAVDDSANGKLALRLAGLLAGSRGITTTVLHLGRAGAEAVVRNAIARSGSSASQQVHRKVHLTLRSNVLPPNRQSRARCRKAMTCSFSALPRPSRRMADFMTRSRALPQCLRGRWRSSWRVEHISNIPREARSTFSFQFEATKSRDGEPRWRSRSPGPGIARSRPSMS
jgi:hypothetical protein